MSDDWIAGLSRYAQRVHAVAGGEHHVASPLGAWLLLALTATADPGPAGRDLAEVLGVTPARAAEVAAALLAGPHPMVAAATAVWHTGATDPDRLARWRTALPPATTVEPLPGKEGLDRWAREHTYGLIEEFPVQPSPLTALMMGSALATRVSWDDPFQLAPAEAFGTGSRWASALTMALRSPQHRHDSYVATTARAGDVIVHAAPATWNGAGHDAALQVISVAAAPGVEPARVLAAAYEIGAARTAGDRLHRLPLPDLPLGETALWSVEETVSSTGDVCTAVLPCWSATSTHGLNDAGLGFDVAARVLTPLTGGGGFAARQAAMARFGRYGFEAAAVTGFGRAGSVPRMAPARSVQLRFGHPYAVVAVAVQNEHTVPPGPWHGVPVFSAWVTTPEDVPAEDRAPRP